MVWSEPQLTALIADITTLDVDAIVNAANEHLAQGGGVCGAIFRAAGPGLQDACRKLAPCTTDEARIRPGFLLPARFIIHAVGPVWHGGGQGEEDLLASAYRSALKLADEHDCRSIAFPAISTGIFGFPLQVATDIAVKTVREHLAGETRVTQVVFTCFSDEVLGAYQAVGVA
ncbi:MAG: O-acetyl-ADP-ribose deacetylase [Planctomycetia bacterium]|nr:O-acetyl-ADP-ribose deacetylase [Planctomycetia bacterium]